MIKFCSSCGSPLVEGSNFCTRCGAHSPQRDSQVSANQEGNGSRYLKYVGIGFGGVVAFIVLLLIIGMLASLGDEELTQVSDLRVSQEGSALRASWYPVAGADHYKVYHDDFFDDSCSVSADGLPRFCDEIALRVTEPNYLDKGASEGGNYYWMVACSTAGCSDIPGKPESFVNLTQSQPRSQSRSQPTQIPTPTPRSAQRSTPIQTRNTPTPPPEPAPVVLGICRDGMRLGPGQGCLYTGGGSPRAKVVLSVQHDGAICREGGPAQQFGITTANLRLCTNGFDRDEAFGSDIAAKENSDGSWSFYESSRSASGAVAGESQARNGPATNSVSLSEFDGASESGKESMFEEGRILECRVGLALPRDSFCLNEGASSLSGASFLVAHLPDGSGLVLRGRSKMQAGGDLQLGWISYEQKGADRVITYLE